MFKDTGPIFTKKDIVTALKTEFDSDEEMLDSRIRSFLSNPFAKKTVLSLICGETYPDKVEFTLLDLLAFSIVFTVFRQRNRLLSSKIMIERIRQSIIVLITTDADLFVWVRGYNQEAAKKNGKSRFKKLLDSDGITCNAAELDEEFLKAKSAGEDFYFYPFRRLVVSGIKNLSTVYPDAGLPMLAYSVTMPTVEMKLTKVEKNLIDTLRSTVTIKNSISVCHSGGNIESFTYEITEKDPQKASALIGSTQIKSELLPNGNHGRIITITKRVTQKD